MKTFQRRTRDGDWEATMDVDSFGKVEVRDTRTNRHFWVRVEG
jgi:hypothetical protein